MDQLQLPEKIPESKENRSDEISTQNVTVKYGDLDEAYWYVQRSNQQIGEGVGEGDARKMRALRRKIDWWIVPIMFCCYTMQFIDKVSLNVCKLCNPRYCQRRLLSTHIVCGCDGAQQRIEAEKQRIHERRNVVLHCVLDR